MFSIYILCVFYVCMTLVCASDIAAYAIPSNNTSTDNNKSDDYLSGKHQSLIDCASITLRHEDAEYVMFQNGTLHVEMYNLTLNASHYVFINDTVTFCASAFGDDNGVEDKEYVRNTHSLTFIGLGVSMVCLLIHLIVFSIVPDLRNMPGWNLAALCASLFCSYSLLFVIGSGEVSENPGFCTSIAFLTHLFLLSSILWMSIMSYDVFKTLLRATGSLRVSSKHFSLKRFGLYCLCSFGTSLLFAVAGVLADVLDVIPAPYKPEYSGLCWFTKKTPLLIFFAGPAIALSCLNFIFFGLSAYTIHFNKMKQKQDEQQSVLKRRYMMYYRLSVIMGVTWIVGIVANATNADWLWYIFVLLNSLQGVFIFIAFTCSQKVKKHFREKVVGGRRSSEQTLAPTFQSYCFYANSIEKDMDKIVENSEEKTDTIIIHL